MATPTSFARPESSAAPSSRASPDAATRNLGSKQPKAAGGGVGTSGFDREGADSSKQASDSEVLASVHAVASSNSFLLFRLQDSSGSSLNPSASVIGSEVFINAVNYNLSDECFPVILFFAFKVFSFGFVSVAFDLRRHSSCQEVVDHCWELLTSSLLRDAPELLPYLTKNVRPTRRHLQH